MKKKLVMKKWVEKVLLVFLLILLFIGASDCENTLAFILIHLGVILCGLGILGMFTYYGRGE